MTYPKDSDAVKAVFSDIDALSMHMNEHGCINSGGDCDKAEPRWAAIRASLAALIADVEIGTALTQERDRLRAALEAIWACYADDDPEYVAAMKVATEDDGVAVMMPVPLVVLRQVRDALTDAEEQR